MIEIEAKFQATSQLALNQIRLRKQVAGYTLSGRQNTPQRDTYFDTKTGLLLRNGACLRLRKKTFASGGIGEGTQLVTFKAQTEEIYTHTELEMSITDQQVQALLNGNLEKVHVEAVEAAVRYLRDSVGNDDRCSPLTPKGEKVLPVLHVDNTRETWHLNADAGRIEVCLDEVRYADMDRMRSVQEYGVELELKAGEPVFLQQIADALSQQYDLVPTFQSKYERGATHLNVFDVKAKD